MSSGGFPAIKYTQPSSPTSGAASDTTSTASATTPTQSLGKGGETTPTSLNLTPIQIHDLASPAPPTYMQTPLKATSTPATSPSPSIEPLEPAPSFVPGFPPQPTLQEAFGKYVLAPRSPRIPTVTGKAGVLRWGIIGHGDPLELQTTQALSSHPGCRVVAVMRPTHIDAKQYASRFNVPKYYTQARSVVDDPEVHIVYIATPPSTHEELAIKVAEAGKVTVHLALILYLQFLITPGHHRVSVPCSRQNRITFHTSHLNLILQACYLDHPMGRSAREARSICDIFRAKNIPLYVGYPRRCSSRVETARRLIEELLGDVTAVSYKFARPCLLDPRAGTMFGWKLDPSYSGGGLFMDIGTSLPDCTSMLPRSLCPLDVCVIIRHAHSHSFYPFWHLYFSNT